MTPHHSEATASGAWFVLAGALLWGTTGTAQAFSPAGFDPKVIGALRLLIGGIALLLLSIRRRELGKRHDWQVLPVILAAAFTAAYQLCFFAAVARTGVAIGTIVGVGSAPISGGVLGLLFRGEKPRRRWFIATTLAIVGCTLLTLSGNESVRIDLFGILLAFGAGLAYASYTLVIKGLLERHPSGAVVAVVTCVGAVMLLPALLQVDLDWLLQPRALAVSLHLGLASMAMAYWLFARGLQTVQVATATTLSLAEPMTAGVLGILVLHEQMNLQAVSGIVLIFAGLVALVSRRKRIERVGNEPAA